MARGQKQEVHLTRAYDTPTEDDGYRVLVDRVWPRGRTKTQLQLERWARELAPTPTLRKWFGHQPERWKEFRKRYLEELAADEQQAALRALLVEAQGRRITLVYGAKDTEHNQAVVLREVLLGLLKR